MSKKTNSGNGLNSDEIGGEITPDQMPAENFPVESTPVGEKKLKMKTIISGAEFWRFSPDEKGHVDGNVFEGYYVCEQLREKDGKQEDQKAGSVIGYVFEQSETGERYIIGKSHSIEKALTAAKFVTDKLMRFIFLGQGKNSAGQNFNRFEIAIEE